MALTQPRNTGRASGYMRGAAEQLRKDSALRAPGVLSQPAFDEPGKLTIPGVPCVCAAWPAISARAQAQQEQGMSASAQ